LVFSPKLLILNNYFFLLIRRYENTITIFLEGSMKHIKRILPVIVLTLTSCAATDSSDSNIKSAVGEFLTIQNTKGNDKAIMTLWECYASVEQLGESKELERCIAFDAALVEHSRIFYKGLAQRFGKESSLQPQDSTREAASKRMMDGASKAKIADPQAYSISIYKKSREVLKELLLK
jgi:hypothetical protein